MDTVEGQLQPEKQVDSSQSAAEGLAFHRFNDLPPEIRLKYGPSIRQAQGSFESTMKFGLGSSGPPHYLQPNFWCVRNLGTKLRRNGPFDSARLLSWDPLRLSAISQEDLSAITSLEIGGIELQRASAETILLSILTMANLRDFSIISPALHDAYRYALSQHLVHPLAAADQEEHWLVHAQKLSYEERRNRAFRQHTEVTRCFRTWAREHRDCQLPRLRLLLLEFDGSRAGPFFWKP
ncbi:hypothetical protein NA56DRAFT_698850 [Hyaloscypha hepaticicola]|uniref:Uncharacterized protein n=1 Tax=Hyaloscypha hepaticicola TaxID=2082293 RepID=A0A2J6QHP3_9HELO|nr:hypothetical protein NA56DRAFT_698850 [Hyaloscypha hepaticicola]